MINDPANDTKKWSKQDIFEINDEEDVKELIEDVIFGQGDDEEEDDGDDIKYTIDEIRSKLIESFQDQSAEIELEGAGE